MIWTLFAILLVLWLLGYGFHVGGWVIHLVLVLAIIIALIGILTPSAARPVYGDTDDKRPRRDDSDDRDEQKPGSGKTQERPS